MTVQAGAAFVANYPSAGEEALEGDALWRIAGAMTVRKGATLSLVLGQVVHDVRHARLAPIRVVRSMERGAKRSLRGLPPVRAAIHLLAGVQLLSVSWDVAVIQRAGTRSAALRGRWTGGMASRLHLFHLSRSPLEMSSLNQPTSMPFCRATNSAGTDRTGPSTRATGRSFSAARTT